MKIRFTKMSGAGNDFIVIDNRSGAITNGNALAIRLCNRRWGIGADGLLLLQKAQDADYRMMYYNADGSYGGMCGNGGRCIARYAADQGIAGKVQNFEALGHTYKATVSENDVVLSMLDPSDIRMNIVLRIGSSRLKMHFVNTGSPHVVIPIGQLKKRYGKLRDIPVEQLGQRIRNDQTFAPEGTNVNFMDKNGLTSIKIRTYERGVEAETLACGTGSVASAIVASKLWKMQSPVRVLPPGGITLSVSFSVNGSAFSDVTLTGQAESIFTGEADVHE